VIQFSDHMLCTLRIDRQWISSEASKQIRGRKVFVTEVHLCVAWALGDMKMTDVEPVKNQHSSIGWPKKIKVGNTFLHNAAPVTLQNARMHAKFWTD